MGDSFGNGRYRVERTLGRGGQKIVFLVHDTSLDRRCALSLVQSGQLGGSQVRRFQLEARALAKVAHPNIVTVFDIGEEDGSPFLLCEYLEGGDLQTQIDGQAPLDSRTALRIVRDVCSALIFAHEAGVIHRDIKPGNIWMLADGTAKLGDFGLALVSGHTRLTQADGMLGTAAYLSPEQALGKAIDARTDLYALGCVLYELLTGRPPFLADSAVALISQHIYCDPQPPEEINAKLEPRVSSLVLRLLAKEANERPPSASALLTELDRLLAEGAQASAAIPMPHNERDRLTALHGLDILDTPPEAAFDDIVSLATQICACPAGYICFVDETRQWMKSRVWFPDAFVHAPREIGVCQTTICQSDVLVCNDLSEDPRFRDLPPVASPPHFRYYCGAPLMTAEGYALGTLVVMDFEPRELEVAQVDALRRLARQVCALIELRKRSMEGERMAKKLGELEQSEAAAVTRAAALSATVTPKVLEVEQGEQNRLGPRFFEQLTLGVVRIAKYAEFSSRIAPAPLFKLVDAYFSACDEIAELHGIEKLKTFADRYFFAVGLAGNSRRYPVDACLAALAMQEAFERIKEEQGLEGLAGIQLGLHTGSAIGGHAGRQKFTYDLWGANVNLALALAHSAAPGQLLVSASTHEQVKDFFDFEQAQARGAGLHQTPSFRLLRIKQALVDDTAADSVSGRS